MKTLILKTTTALTLGAGLALSGVASAENWTTHTFQVVANAPSAQFASDGARVGENYQTYLRYIRANGAEVRSEGQVLVGENYQRHLNDVRERTEARKAASLDRQGEQARSGPRHGRHSVLEHGPRILEG
ncbi:hypothetical protein ACN2MM_08865 [Alkalilimnicola ehrlichii MLHE-1]|uniref:DUF4148 domain-containing protein n=1 Tax=Alkalilimnicola ehrlichii (strain ATCC BAA-1101 / DSM 17681 / MLHE-1) TaxID=187272 RepID=Q0A865_ALKEH|nr:hypothetical protein [Alkalilimnicola ehrlichii]ABI56972.1 hypothetical protein Mlg_1626 [Alkalilimnicola ehrlichii MLHE-1]